MWVQINCMLYEYWFRRRSKKKYKSNSHTSTVHIINNNNKEEKGNDLGKKKDDSENFSILRGKISHFFWSFTKESIFIFSTVGKCFLNCKWFIEFTQCSDCSQIYIYCGLGDFIRKKNLSPIKVVSSHTHLKGVAVFFFVFYLSIFYYYSIRSFFCSFLYFLSVRCIGGI